MQKALFPGYTVGPDAYDDIVNICSAYGKKAAIIGGRKALAAAEPQIRKAVEGSGIEIIGTFWYGGEASRENMDMLRASGGGRRHDLRGGRRQGHRHLQGAGPRDQPALLHLPHHRLHLRLLHQFGHRVPS